MQNSSGDTVTLDVDRPPRRSAPKGGGGIRFDNVSVAYNGNVVLDSFSLDVAPGEVVALLGPSGSGKTTALRAVAGFVQPVSGRVHAGGQDVTDLPPYQRGLGMVVQQYALFPHMRVDQNVAFGLKAQKVAKTEIPGRVAEALRMTGMGDYANRYPRQLSGGQQQRVAIARALAIQPSVLLLDEPLSALDAQLRSGMLAELARLHRELPDVSILYVTHDQIEALAMSNRIALMSDGHIVQEGRPRELYQKPATEFVASFLGSTNLLEGEVLERADSMWLLRTPAGQITAACPHGVQAGSKVTVSLRPENISIHPQAPSSGNVLQGEVEQFMFLGEMAECRVKVGGSTLRTRQHPNVSFAHGEQVYVQLPYESCTVISDEHGVMAPEYREEAVPA
jgi:2-aminoethylphosphonate transport system ATP-binding protein